MRISDWSSDVCSSDLFVRFVHEQGLSRRNPLRAEICTGLLTLNQNESGQVDVEMGRTRFEPEDLAFDADGLRSRRCAADTVWTLPPTGHTSVDISQIGNASRTERQC